MCYNENIRQKVQIIETEVNELGILDDINQIIDYISANENLFRIIAAVLIILITLAFRKLFARFISAVVIKLTEKTKTKLDDYIVGVVNRPLSFAFIVVGVWLGVLVLKLPPRFDEFMGRVVSSLLAFAVFWAAYRASGVIASCIERFVKRTDSKIDDMILPLLKNSVKVIVVVIGITVIVDQWGYNIAGLLAGLGLGGLAFALAAQDTAANLFGGITVMLDKPFSIGDWILPPGGRYCGADGDKEHTHKDFCTSAGYRSQFGFNKQPDHELVKDGQEKDNLQAQAHHMIRRRINCGNV